MINVPGRDSHHVLTAWLQSCSARISHMHAEQVLIQRLAASLLQQDIAIRRILQTPAVSGTSLQVTDWQSRIGSMMPILFAFYGQFVLLKTPIAIWRCVTHWNDSNGGKDYGGRRILKYEQAEAGNLKQLKFSSPKWKRRKKIRSLRGSQVF